MADLTSTPSVFNFSMVTGDSKVARARALNRDRTAFDLTDATSVSWVLKKTETGAALLEKTMLDGSITVDLIDEFWFVSVNLDAVDTADLAAGAYLHECQVTLSTGQVFTPYRGTITFTKGLI